MLGAEGERDATAEIASMLSFTGQHEAAPPDAAALARAKRRRRIGLIAALLVALLVIGSIGAYVSAALNAPIEPADVTLAVPAVAPAASAALALPAWGSTVVSVTGPPEFATLTGAPELAASAGSAEAQPMASITKVITALVVLDARPLAPEEPGPTIAFTKADVDLYEKYYVLGATVQSMKPGATMSERDALKMLLVASASNYAEAVANWAFGSPAGFRGAASAWLAKNGFASTRVVEPSGIDARNVSTPAELLALGRIVAAHPVLSAIVQLPGLDVVGAKPANNSNFLLGSGGITGIKTGTLEPYGANLLFSAKLDVGLSAPLDVIGVNLGSYDHATIGREVLALLESIKAGFHTVPLIEQGVELGSYTTAWGEEATIVSGQSASVLTWSDSAVTASANTEAATTADAGARVGTLTFDTGATTVEVPLELREAIREPTDWWRLTHPSELFGW